MRPPSQGKFVNFGGKSIAHGALRQWVASLLTLLFVARALIPVGYMPDFSAATKGVFKVVICSAFGAKTVALDADGTPIPHPKGDQHEQPCAFTGMAAVSLPVADAMPVEARDFQVLAVIPRLAVQLPPARAGPQLGSRGPPLVS